MKSFPTSENEQDLAAELRNALSRLSPEDNFRGFLWEGTLEAGVEKRIPNKMRDGSIPRGMLILQIEGQPTIVKGVAEWTAKAVFIKNTASTSTVTAKIYFYR